MQRAGRDVWVPHCQCPQTVLALWGMQRLQGLAGLGTTQHVPRVTRTRLGPCSMTNHSAGAGFSLLALGNLPTLAAEPHPGPALTLEKPWCPSLPAVSIHRTAGAASWLFLGVLTPQPGHPGGF